MTTIGRQTERDELMAQGAQGRGGERVVAQQPGGPHATGSHAPTVPDGAPPSRVVVTAGHVDHGKSTLVEWLTGTHPDRWEEERRRGLTIDLGFGSTVLGNGIEVGLVDVPGHVRFLKNMLAGLGAVDACLFVVAATEGWKPQSEDHLQILDVLGMAHAVVALTHAALVPAGRLEAVRRELAERAVGTFLERAPVVAVDVPAGIGTEGTDGLRSALTTMVSGLPAAPDVGRPRLWVDRSFSIRGAGAVVTGTLAGGTIAVGDRLDLTRRQLPEALPVRVRSLQSYGRPIERAEPGRRLAVNLSGVDHHEVGRGDSLVHGRQWHRCTTVDASLRVLGHLDHAVSRRGAYVAHVGTGEQAVRLRVLGRAAEIEPGAQGVVRLWLATPLPLVPGDRYVLREVGRQEVVGGGEVLDVAPVLPLSKAAPDRSVARVVAERGWVEADELERLTGAPHQPVVGHWVVDPTELARTTEMVAERVRASGPTGLDISALDERARTVAGGLVGLQISHGIARFVEASARPGAGASGDGASGDGGLGDHPYLRALRAAPFSPPGPDGVDRNDLRRLVRDGLVVEAAGVWFAASAVADAAGAVARLLDRSPAGVRVSDVRDVLGTSRRYALALLSHFDANGVTRRRDDLRIAGPKLAALAGLAAPAGLTGTPSGPSDGEGEGDSQGASREGRAS